MFQSSVRFRIFCRPAPILEDTGNIRLLFYYYLNVSQSVLQVRPSVLLYPIRRPMSAPNTQVNIRVRSVLERSVRYAKLRKSLRSEIYFRPYPICLESKSVSKVYRTFLKVYNICRQGSVRILLARLSICPI